MVPKFKCYLIIIGCFQVIFSGTSKQGEAYEYFLKGEYEILQNNFRQAEKHYTKALSLSPDSPTILRSLVDLKSYQGEYEDAIQYLEKILELEPDNKDSGLDLYQLHVQAGNLIKAERVLDTLLIHFPGDQDILFARANTQYSEQDWSNLLKTYQSIYVGEPTQTNILKKIYEIGIASKYSNSPVEMIAINDVINLISYISNSQKIQLSHYYDFPDKKKQKKTLFKSYSEYESILGELINKYGVSTSENSVRNHIIKKLPSWAKPIVDEKGNLILTFGEGENHKVFVAHMDETGYIVNDIKNDGRLELKMLGGMLPWLWEAQPATIHLRHKKITGVFEPRLDYLTSKKRKSNFPLNVNAGFLSKSEALEAGVIIGETTITMPKEMIRLNENRVTGRSFDDRVGCAALILALNKINPRELKNKITFVWSVEEEIGLRGAKHSAINLKNASIVYPVDTYVSSDDPYKDESFANAPLGNGAVIRVLESINFVSRENFKMIRKLADNNNIKTQYGMTSGGTDGQPFLSYGIPSVPISWPGRYSHSPIEIMDLRDMNSLVKLIKAVIED